MTAVAARQAVRSGFSLHAGEAVPFLVTNSKDRDPDSRVRIVQLLRAEDSYDVDFYVEQVYRCAETVLEAVFEKNIEALLQSPRKRIGNKKRLSTKLH